MSLPTLKRFTKEMLETICDKTDIKRGEERDPKGKARFLLTCPGRYNGNVPEWVVCFSGSGTKQAEEYMRPSHHYRVSTRGFLYADNPHSSVCVDRWAFMQGAEYLSRFIEADGLHPKEARRMLSGAALWFSTDSMGLSPGSFSDPHPSARVSGMFAEMSKRHLDNSADAIDCATCDTASGPHTRAVIPAKVLPLVALYAQSATRVTCGRLLVTSDYSIALWRLHIEVGGDSLTLLMRGAAFTRDEDESRVTPEAWEDGTGLRWVGKASDWLPAIPYPRPKAAKDEWSHWQQLVVMPEKAAHVRSNGGRDWLPVPGVWRSGGDMNDPAQKLRAFSLRFVVGDVRQAIKAIKDTGGHVEVFVIPNTPKRGEDGQVLVRGKDFSVWFRASRGYSGEEGMPYEHFID